MLRSPGYNMLWSCSTSQNILLTHFSMLLAFLDFWGSSDSSVWSVITDLDASNRGSVWGDYMVAYPCSIAISENRFPTYFVPKTGVARLLLVWIKVSKDVLPHISVLYVCLGDWITYEPAMLCLTHSCTDVTVTCTVMPHCIQTEHTLWVSR